MRTRKARSDKIVIPEDALRHLYVVERLTDHQIAARYGCGDMVVFKSRREYGIPTIKAKAGGGRLLTDELLRREYQEAGLTNAQIGAKYGVNGETVRHYVNRAGIPTHTALTRRNQPDLRSNPEAFGLLLGTMLGDGHLGHVGRRFRLELKHAKSQEDWLAFKTERLSSVLTFTWKWHGMPRPQEGWGQQEQVRAISACHPGLDEIHPWFYTPGRTRIIAPEALAALTELGLVAWIVDDGTLNKSKGHYLVYTLRYPMEDVMRAAAAVNLRFGLHCYARPHRDRWIISFPTQDTETVASMLERHVGGVEGVRYKIARSA